jgi:Ni/Fe-hydrogenase subunit HybB-like protein
VPDLATLRDRAKTRLRYWAYGIPALGWRGANRHWQNYERAYLVLAGLATPLVLSVHTIVSFDFAVSVIPGWHTTIFPPYFVAGAIFSGFAMVQTLAVPSRKIFGLEDFITVRHVENMNKVILVTGCMVGYAYAMEFFIAWYSAAPYESFAFVNRAFGPYGWAYFIMVSCNVITPQLFWSKKIRTSMVWTFILSIFVNIGMWFERFVITMSLHRDYLPSSWGYYRPTIFDILTFVGSFGLFFTLTGLPGAPSPRAPWRVSRVARPLSYATATSGGTSTSTETTSCSVTCPTVPTTSRRFPPRWSPRRPSSSPTARA